MRPTLLPSLLISSALLLTGCSQYSKVSQKRMSAVTVTAEQKALTKSLKPLAKQPLVRLGRYLDSADAARVTLKANPSDSIAQSDYNFAVARIVEIIEEENLAPWDKPISSQSAAGGEWSLSLTPPDPRPEYHPSHFGILPSDRYDFKGKLVGERNIKQGLGAPTVVIGKDLDFTKIDEFAQGKQVFYALTAVIRFHGKKCELVLIDPLRADTVPFEGRSYPLAADFQAPLALSLAALNPRKGELAELFKSDEFVGTARLSRLQPYDPEKIPVLFIHGLSNSSATWMPMIDFLRNDPEIRKRYQFWLFNYPTGLPYPIPAATLRRQLDGMKRRYPDHKDIVMIGHSMGGMIARLLLTDSDMMLWNGIYDKSPTEMVAHGEMSDETRLVMSETLIFEARPHVSRVIFASASHRGSTHATNFMGKLGAKLIGNPIGENQINSEALAAARPGTAASKRKHLPNSVDVLNPDSPFLKAVNALPLKAGVPYHSIIGDRGKGGNLDHTKPVSSDGIVPYWSSHLDGARSELIIPSKHWTILHPQGMTEVQRILHLHTEKS